MARTKRRFLSDLHVRVPPEVNEAVSKAADKNMTTPAEYIRRAIFHQLELDDLDPRNASVGA